MFVRKKANKNRSVSMYSLFFFLNVKHDSFEDKSLIEESDVLPFEDRGVWGFGLGYRLEFGGASSQEE